MIAVVPTSETIGSEQHQVVHIHREPGSNLFTSIESRTPPQLLDGKTQEDAFLENVQFLVFHHPVVSEYMVQGWSRGHSKLPQWIELYNPHSAPVNLKGWRLKYVEKGKIRTRRLRNFEIPANGTAILATREAQWLRGLSQDAAYILDIPNVLKKGWHLLDVEGNTIHRIGIAFRTDENLELGDPTVPNHQNRARVSQNRYASDPSPDIHYYGHSADIGTPGFFQLPTPAAPSKARPKLQTSWGKIKKQEK